MKLSNHSSVPVYTIAGSSTARPLPEWLARQRKRSLKNDPEFANRIELLQDFEFEEASCCIRASDDGQWVMSTAASLQSGSQNADITILLTDFLFEGTYKPQIHTHYLPHLSLSFSRHTTSLNHTFLLLSSDYSKSLHLQTDRSLEFHTPQGCHYVTRVPRYGRDLKFDRRSAEALIPSVGVNGDGNGEVFRLNLEVGRFMKGYEINVGGDDLSSAGGGALQGGIGTGNVNAAAIAEDSHNLLAFGTSIGTVEFWDSRSRSRVGIVSTPTDFDGRPEVTALEFHQSGLSLATGSSSGLIHLYDLRSPTPLLRKDQGYGYPIQTLTFLDSSTSSRGQNLEPKIMSADKRIIKIWDPRDSTPWTSVEPAVDLNSVIWCKDSGMILTANEGRQQHSFFIPQLGPAPKWCSFLDNLTEENEAFEERSVYDNFTFVTKPQLSALSLDHLIGTTGLLRPYMHGYFVNQKLYDQARAISNPHEYEEARAARLREKVESQRNSRIRGAVNIKAPKVKVNKALAEKMIARQEKRMANRPPEVDEAANAAETTGEGENTVGDQEDTGGLLADPRFSALFQDEDFAVDEESREFQSLNPNPKRTDPTTAPNLQVSQTRPTIAAAATAADSDDEHDPASDSDSDAIRRSKPEMRISTSSYKRSGHRSQTGTAAGRDNERDRAFGKRVLKTTAGGRGGATAPAKGDVVGDKEVRWDVGGGKNNHRNKGGDRGYSKGGRGNGDGSGGGKRKMQDRRSASNNTLMRR
ncbi:MAG: hypothetical protein M1837_005463 [Sclerophora amabilis]|nr:MAG: hypothetical protein M1837_005463 [Sclerophora amabilis]